MKSPDPRLKLNLGGIKKKNSLIVEQSTPVPSLAKNEHSSFFGNLIEGFEEHNQLLFGANP